MQRCLRKLKHILKYILDTYTYLKTLKYVLKDVINHFVISVCVFGRIRIDELRRASNEKVHLKGATSQRATLIYIYIYIYTYIYIYIYKWRWHIKHSIP